LSPQIRRSSGFLDRLLQKLLLIHVLCEPVRRGPMAYRDIYIAGLARIKHEGQVWVAVGVLQPQTATDVAHV
jgi:hypothetical protein